MIDMHSTIQERVWELHALKKDLEDQLADVKALLEQAQADAYAEGIRELDNGYTIIRSEIRDISIRSLRERHADIYTAALAAKIAKAEPELTKSDLRAYLKESGYTQEDQEAILRDIETGRVQYRFSLRKPADPHAKEVIE